MGSCGACLERAGCVLLFAILYLLSTISSIISAIVFLVTWDYDGEFPFTNADKEEVVKVNGDGFIALTMGFIAIQKPKNKSPSQIAL